MPQGYEYFLSGVLASLFAQAAMWGVVVDVYVIIHGRGRSRAACDHLRAGMGPFRRSIDRATGNCSSERQGLKRGPCLCAGFAVPGRGRWHHGDVCHCPVCQVETPARQGGRQADRFESSGLPLSRLLCCRLWLLDVRQQSDRERAVGSLGSVAPCRAHYERHAHSAEATGRAVGVSWRRERTSTYGQLRHS